MTTKDLITVVVHLKDQSQPLVYAQVENTYEKGSFFCVYTSDEMVYKHPIADIWRIKEGYGYHGRED
jgi:hypothetical protein